MTALVRKRLYDSGACVVNMEPCEVCRENKSDESAHASLKEAVNHLLFQCSALEQLAFLFPHILFYEMLCLLLLFQVVLYLELHIKVTLKTSGAHGGSKDGNCVIFLSNFYAPHGDGLELNKQIFHSTYTPSLW